MHRSSLRRFHCAGGGRTHVRTRERSDSVLRWLTVAVFTLEAPRRLARPLHSFL
jgi:hypothetical protein